MHPIVPMAVITVAFSAALWCGMLWLYSGRTMRFVRLVWLGLPLSAIVNLAVKGPLAKGVGELAGVEPGLGLETPVWFLVFLFLLAPVFEELIKAAPALLPAVRRHIGTPGDALWAGMALGMGFGLGEAIYLAWQVTVSGAYTEYPWYAFTGFFGERLLVVFMHGMMTGLLFLIAKRGYWVRGYLAAAGAHALLNSGAMLYQLELAPGWAASASLGVMLIGFAVLFERIRPKCGVMERPDDTVYFSGGV
ncbi:MAG: PrsW family intramembrane metalloprotease [Coriobacteriia bacterium]|nr:PrsW family intramembrane metalloprotease [Coriobacteriia bacterium]MBN2847702.1 PrsW family intramembrane metalloprotease [Coriobacteriia bacterium]